MGASRNNQLKQSPTTSQIAQYFKTKLASVKLSLSLKDHSNHVSPILYALIHLIKKGQELLFSFLFVCVFTKNNNINTNFSFFFFHNMLE